MLNIPWSEPNISFSTVRYLRRVMNSGWYSMGPETRRFEKELGDYLGNPFVVVVNNGTSAIIASLIALGVNPGDEVLVPANTFVATINSVISVGAKPVLVDCDNNTWLIDPADAIKKITPKTVGIIPVDVAGMPVNYSFWSNICEKNNLFCLIDSAESLGAEIVPEFKTKKIFFVYSFHMAKQVAGIEGGAIIAYNKKLTTKTRQIRNHGSDSLYHYKSFGLNLRISDLHCTIARQQLLVINETLSNRETITNYYRKNLKNVLTQKIPSYVKRHANLFFAVRTKKREELITALEKENVGYRITWPYINDQPYHKTLGLNNCPITKKLSQEIISLPLYNHLPLENVKKVVKLVNGVLS